MGKTGNEKLNFLKRRIAKKTRHNKERAQKRKIAQRLGGYLSHAWQVRKEAIMGREIEIRKEAIRKREAKKRAKT